MHVGSLRLTNMKYNELFKSRFVKADALDKPLKLTISGVSVEEVGDDKKEKRVVTFTEREEARVFYRRVGYDHIKTQRAFRKEL